MDLSPNPQDSDGQNQTMPLRDFGSFVSTSNVSDAEIKGKYIDINILWI